MGDFLADCYLTAEPTRISREAPVLILRETGRHIRPGGAGNAAANVAALGGVVEAVGLVGDDEPGRSLRQVLAASGLKVTGLVEVPGGQTITKTRVVAGSRHAVQQQVLRIDRAEEWEPPAWAREQLYQALERALARADGVLIADYAARVVDEPVVDQIRQARRRRPLPVVIDTRHRLPFFHRVGLPTPNQSEVEEWLGQPLHTQGEAAWAAQELCRRLEVEAALVTRGEEGLIAARAGGPTFHVPAFRPTRVYDVTGAGDTVAAVLALAQASGGSLLQAALLAVVAGGIVVRKPGTATVTSREMLAYLNGNEELPHPSPVEPQPPGGSTP